MSFVPRVDNFFKKFQPLDSSLGILGAIPKIRSCHFLIDYRDLAFLGLKVKDTPLSLGASP